MRCQWNHELLGEHEGGTTQSVQDVRLRLAERRIEARSSGIGLLTIRRRVDDEPLGYCGLIVGRCSLDEPEIAYELLKRFHGYGYATEAAHAVMDAAFTTGRNRIWSIVEHGTNRLCGSWTNLAFNATTRASTIAAESYTWCDKLQDRFRLLKSCRPVQADRLGNTFWRKVSQSAPEFGERDA
jgi:hypothetical protein